MDKAACNVVNVLPFEVKCDFILPKHPPTHPAHFSRANDKEPENCMAVPLCPH